MQTILVIDDDVSIRKMIREYLELNKYTVITAENGKDGLELANKFIPDLIICDVLMPGMNGYKVKEKLGKERATSTIPFIYLTSQTEGKHLRKGMELGADDYLFKPFKLKELANSMDTQLLKREELIKEYSDRSELKEKDSYDYKEHILLKARGTPKFVKLNSIVYIMAEEKYTKLFLTTKEKLIISKSLKEWETLLPSKNFVRIHRSTIINIEFVEKLEKWFNRSYKIKMSATDEPLFISRRYYSKLKNAFN